MKMTLIKLKDFFRGIREPFIIEEVPCRSGNNIKIYDPVKLGIKTIWIPNNCWPAGARQFERLLKVANKVNGLTLE